MSAFSWPVRVYWEDTDAGGVVYYATYLRFLERARTEWLRSCGFSQQALAQDPGIIFPVVNLRIQYKRPARLDDELLVSCEARSQGATAISFSGRAHAGRSRSAGRMRGCRHVPAEETSLISNECAGRAGGPLT